MATVIEICNLALTHLGQAPIISFEDPNNRVEELCGIHYPLVRDVIVESRMWTFATVRARIETTQKDEWGAQYLHNVPEDWLKVFRAYRRVNVTGKGPQANWVMEGNKILSDEKILYIWGVIRITDPSTFPPMVVSTMAERLASDMCVTITENRRLKNDLLKAHEKSLNEASSRDGGQGRSEIIESNRLIGARYK